MILHTRGGGRRGITLLECLTAIFIMGVGLLAILTLFPLGALSMARGVRDDRAAAAGANAAALAIAHDLRTDQTVVSALTTTPPADPSKTYSPPDPNGPGYPVLVDPVYLNLGAFRLGAVKNLTPGLARCSTDYLAVPNPPIYPPGYPTNPPAPYPKPAAWQAQAIARWFSFTDELPFDTTGQPTGSQTNPPATPNIGTVNRPGTYSWTYLMRRARPGSSALTELSVIVYAGRATDAPGGETTSSLANAGLMGVKGTNTVVVTYPTSADKPNFRKGSWVLDSSYRQISATAGTVNGYFYQVAAATDTGAGNMTLELETTLKEDVTTMVLLENVITVLDRGASWKP